MVGSVLLKVRAVEHNKGYKLSMCPATKITRCYCTCMKVFEIRIKH